MSAPGTLQIGSESSHVEWQITLLLRELGEYRTNISIVSTDLSDTREIAFFHVTI